MSIPLLLFDESYPEATTVTRAGSIRDRVIQLIAAITPTAATSSAPSNGFFAYRNEGDGSFVKFAEKNPTNAYRRFQVRDDGIDEPPAVSNMDLEERKLTFDILVAYPLNQRTGKQAALDRDDTMDEDFHAIDYAVGMYGRANFTAPYPDATPMGCSRRVEHGNACDFLVITAHFLFKRSL